MKKAEEAIKQIDILTKKNDNYMEVANKIEPLINFAKDTIENNASGIIEKIAYKIKIIYNEKIKTIKDSGEKITEAKTAAEEAKAKAEEAIKTAEEAMKKTDGAEADGADGEGKQAVKGTVAGKTDGAAAADGEGAVRVVKTDEAEATSQTTKQVNAAENELVSQAKVVNAASQAAAEAKAAAEAQTTAETKKLASQVAETKAAAEAKAEAQTTAALSQTTAAASSASQGGSLKIPKRLNAITPKRARKQQASVLRRKSMPKRKNKNQNRNRNKKSAKNVRRSIT